MQLFPIVVHAVVVGVVGDPRRDHHLEDADKTVGVGAGVAAVLTDDADAGRARDRRVESELGRHRRRIRICAPADAVAVQGREVIRRGTDGRPLGAAFGQDLNRRFEQQGTVQVAACARPPTVGAEPTAVGERGEGQGDALDLSGERCGPGDTDEAIDLIVSAKPVIHPRGEVAVVNVSSHTGVQTRRARVRIDGIVDTHDAAADQGGVARVTGGVLRVRALAHLDAVRETVGIRVLDQRLGPVRVHFRAVTQPVSVGVGQRRIGLVRVDFGAVAQPVAVGVGHQRVCVRSLHFVAVVQSVTVRVALVGLGVGLELLDIRQAVAVQIARRRR